MSGGIFQYPEPSSGGLVKGTDGNLYEAEMELVLEKINALQQYDNTLVSIASIAHDGLGNYLLGTGDSYHTLLLKDGSSFPLNKPGFVNGQVYSSFIIHDDYFYLLRLLATTSNQTIQLYKSDYKIHDPRFPVSLTSNMTLKFQFVFTTGQISNPTYANMSMDLDTMDDIVICVFDADTGSGSIILNYNITSGTGGTVGTIPDTIRTGSNISSVFNRQLYIKNGIMYAWGNDSFTRSYNKSTLSLIATSASNTIGTVIPQFSTDTKLMCSNASNKNLVDATTLAVIVTYVTNGVLRGGLFKSPVDGETLLPNFYTGISTINNSLTMLNNMTALDYDNSLSPLYKAKINNPSNADGFYSLSPLFLYDFVLETQQVWQNPTAQGTPTNIINVYELKIKPTGYKEV